MQCIGVLLGTAAGGRLRPPYPTRGEGKKSASLTRNHHDRPISDDILSGGRTGWPAILSSLKSLLETGEALVIKMEPAPRMLAALKKMGIRTP